MSEEPRPGHEHLLPSEHTDHARPHQHHPLDIDYEPPVAPQERKRGKKVLILVILCSVMMAALAQLTLKKGVDRVTHENNGKAIVLGHPVESAIRVAKEPLIWGGLALFGLSAAIWIVVLSRVSLSFAYPFAALTYVIILLFDRFVLHETIPTLRWIGVGFVVTGILVISRTPHA